MLLKNIYHLTTTTKIKQTYINNNMNKNIDTKYNNKMVKFLILADLHGRKPEIYSTNFDVIIAPGDFCCDKQIGKLYKKYFTYLKKTKQKTINWEEFIEKEIACFS